MQLQTASEGIGQVLMLLDEMLVYYETMFTRTNRWRLLRRWQIYTVVRTLSLTFNAVKQMYKDAEAKQGKFN